MRPAGKEILAYLQDCEAEMLAAAKTRAEQLEGLEISITAKSGGEGKLFGSVIMWRYREIAMEKGDAALFVSQSGETADTLAALREIQRVGQGQSFVTLGAYRTQEERELLEDWTLLGTTVLHVDEWMEVFQETGYTGDYAFTTASSLNLVRG